MITVDMSKPAYWVLSGKTHTISGGLHYSEKSALAAAEELAKKEGSEALVVKGIHIAVPAINVKSWP